MPNYKNGKIYTIRCVNDTNVIYVGSTTALLSKRLGQHKSNKSSSVSIFNNNDWTDWYIELYEEYPCDIVEQLHKREGEVIRQIATINKVVAGRTTNERYAEVKEMRLKAQKYREEHQEEIHKYNVEYHAQHKESDNLRCQKRWEELPQDDKDNKASKRRENKVLCECGEEVNKDRKKRHDTSKKHILALGKTQ
jgi:GIY-YIG catalytic domain